MVTNAGDVYSVMNPLRPRAMAPNTAAIAA
jgi:hypothetical protein